MGLWIVSTLQNAILQIVDIKIIKLLLLHSHCIFVITFEFQICICQSDMGLS